MRPPSVAMARSAPPIVRRVFAIVAAMLVVLATSGKAFAGLPRPTPADPLVDTAGHLSMLVDEPGALRVEDVVAHPERFAPSARAVPNLGVTTHTLWARAELARGDAPFYAEVPYPAFDHLTLVVEREDGSLRTVEAGDQRPFAAREIDAPTFVFEVREPAKALYLRVATRR